MFKKLLLVIGAISLLALASGPVAPPFLLQHNSSVPVKEITPPAKLPTAPSGLPENFDPGGDLSGPWASEGKKSPEPPINFFIGLLTRLGFYSHPSLSPHYALQRANQENLASPLQPQVSLPPAWQPPHYMQEKRFMAQVQPFFATPKSLSCTYCFPVAGPFSFRDSWGDPRPGGRYHQATDIAAVEGTPVFAVTSGVICALATLPAAGITLLMQGQDGRSYGYMHLMAYAPGIVEGKAVKAGEFIGYVGRTGVKESAAHLHFQVYADHHLAKDQLLNPYTFLVQLCHGVGVTDLNQPKLARLPYPELRPNQIIKPGQIMAYRPAPPTFQRVEYYRTQRSLVIVVNQKFLDCKIFLDHSLVR